MTPQTDYRLIPLTMGQSALVDPEDFETFGIFNWRAHWDPHGKCFYAVRNLPRENGKRGSVSLHREILGLKRGDKRQGDHHNHNTLDNRRSNLRIASTFQQAWNVRVKSLNRSGFKGVRKEEKGGRVYYHVYIRIKGKKTYLGTRYTPEDAHALYCEAAKREFGEFFHP